MLKFLALAVKQLWREWRAGEWLIVFIALLLAVTATTSLHFYTDRLTRGLEAQGARFLGGDLVISSSSPIPELWLKQAHAMSLRTAQVWAYPTVVSVHNRMQLVNLQAVSDAYPLLGQSPLHLAPQTVWVEPRLLPLLGLHVGEQMPVGAASFKIQALLTPDIDMLNTGWTIAPRVMMRLADVPETRTVIPGSRIDYRLLLAGAPDDIAAFQRWITPQLTSAQRVLDVNNAQSGLNNVIDRTDNFLQLALLVCLLMSGVAIVMSMQQYLRRHLAYVALWRCLGADRKQIILIFVWQAVLIALAAGALAVLTACALQSLFARLFTQYLQFPLPAAGFAPVISGFLTSLFLLFSFSFPVMNQLPQTPPLYIWRNEIAFHKRNDLYFIGGVLLVMLFIVWFMHFTWLAFYFLSLIIVSVALLYVIARFLLACLRMLARITDGAVRRGISQLAQHSLNTSVQFIGFSMILIALVVLAMVRNQIISSWQDTLSTRAPNYFAFNIAPADVQTLRQLLTRNRVVVEGIYPMIRGRLTSLNGRPIMQAVPPSALNNNALHRDLNLSWMWRFPSDNKIVAGRPWGAQDENQPLVSVENGVADALQIHLGDELTFRVGDQSLTVKVVSLRSVQWGSFHPNFFMIFPPGDYARFPTTYITSFHLRPAQTELLNQVVQAYPNITVIDIASLLRQMQDLLGKITLAMEYLFLFALSAGVLIFITCIQASMDERKTTYRLLRVLGAGKGYIMRSLATEFCCLAIIITGSALAIGGVMGWLIEQYVMGL